MPLSSVLESLSMLDYDSDVSFMESLMLSLFLKFFSSLIIDILIGPSPIELGFSLIIYFFY